MKKCIKVTIFCQKCLTSCLSSVSPYCLDMTSSCISIVSPYCLDVTTRTTAETSLTRPTAGGWVELMTADC